MQTPARQLALLAALAAVVVAWFLENWAIHLMGYSGFAGAGWLTAIIVPLGAGCWVWGKVAGLGRSDG